GSCIRRSHELSNFPSPSGSQKKLSPPLPLQSSIPVKK
ncbi:hypothetical protein J007_06376, partial [Cryptococcus neoformans]